MYADGPSPRDVGAEKQAIRDQDGISQQERELQELIERTLAEKRDYEVVKCFIDQYRRMKTTRPIPSAISSTNTSSPRVVADHVMDSPERRKQSPEDVKKTAGIWLGKRFGKRLR
jgi:hypothetical protein